MDLIAIVSKGYFTKDAGKGSAVYYCIDLPKVTASRDVSPKLITQRLGVKLVMEDLSPKPLVDNLSAEEYIEDLIPKLILK